MASRGTNPQSKGQEELAQHDVSRSQSSLYPEQSATLHRGRQRSPPAATKASATASASTTAPSSKSPSPHPQSQASSPTSHTPHRRQAYTTLVAGWLALFCGFGFTNAFGVFEDYLAEDYLPGRSHADISWIGALQVFLIYLGNVASGPLLDRIGPRPLMAFFAVVFTLGCMMTSLCTEYWQLLLAQGLLLGSSLSLGWAPMLSCALQWFPGKGGPIAAAAVVSGSSFGGILWPIIVRGLLDSVGFGWTWRVLGFIGLALLSTATLLAHRAPITVHRVLDDEASPTADTSMLSSSRDEEEKKAEHQHPSALHGRNTTHPDGRDTEQNHTDGDMLAGLPPPNAPPASSVPCPVDQASPAQDHTTAASSATAPRPVQRRQLFYPEMLRSRSWLLYTVGICLMEMGFFYLFFYLPSIGRHYGMSTSLASHTVSIVQSGSVIGRIAFPLPAHKLGVFNMMTLSSLSTTAVAFGSIAAKSPGGVLAVGACYGFASGGVVALMSPCIGAVTPDRSRLGASQGQFSGLLAVPAMLGAPVSGWIVGAAGGDYTAGASFSGGCLALGTVFVLAARLSIDTRLRAAV